MNQGGVETWLMNLLRRADRGQVQMDFLVHTDRPGAYDAEVQRLGSRVFSCPFPQNVARYAARFGAIVREFGPYDVVHSHVHSFSGAVLWLGRMAGIPMRIAHSHTDESKLAGRYSVARRAYLRLSRRLIRAHCTRGLAVSREAAADLFGTRWEDDRRVRILPCSIDLAPFRRPIDRAAVRRELGFQDGDRVFGHVGNFHPVKNHRFLLEIAVEIARREPQARFLLVGDGPLRPAMEETARRDGLENRIVFAGLSSDVPRLLTGAMDGFLFPSHTEGLPMALIEAQAASLPATISDAISPEASVVPALVQRISLEKPAAVWAEGALSHRGSGGDGLGAVAGSRFNIATGLGDLIEIYTGGKTAGVTS
jgi:glycosyltransferase involved in cell wall biosynthesis